MQNKLLLIQLSVYFGCILCTTASVAQEFEFWVSYDVNYIDASEKFNKSFDEDVARNSRNSAGEDKDGKESLSPVVIANPCNTVSIEYRALKVENVTDYKQSDRGRLTDLDVTVPLGEFCGFRHFVFDVSNKALIVLKEKGDEYFLHDYEELKHDKNDKWYISSEEFISEYGFGDLTTKIDASDECRKVFTGIQAKLEKEGIDDVVHIDDSFVCPGTGVYIEDIATRRSKQ